MTNKKIVYIEGPDCAGKTTLVEALKRKGDCVLHNGLYPSPEVAYQAYIDQLAMFKASSYDRLILDRGVLSEVVYGLVMRHHKPDAVQFKVITDILESFDYKIVICLPPFGRTVMKWARRQDEEYVDQFEKYTLIYNYYRELAQETNEAILHDYTHNHLEVISHVNS